MATFFKIIPPKLKNNNTIFLPYLAIIITSLICLLFVIYFIWNSEKRNTNLQIIDSDGIGYYMYLPNIFLNKTICNQESDDRYILNVSGKEVNKYYVGTAVAMSPFFYMAHIYAKKQGVKTDGYTLPFQKAISIAGLFYLIAGLIFLLHFLQLYEIKNSIIAIVIISVVLGTNLLTYSVISPSMSHIYSWAFINAFLYFIKKTSLSFKTHNFIFSVIAFSIIILIRPLNGLIILSVPFLTGSMSNLKRFTQYLFSIKKIIIGFTIIFSILCIQFYLWYLQSGSFIIYSYKDEGFYFFNPQIWNVLFSFRKGFFVYTPLALISIISFYFIWKQNRFEFFGLVIFFVFLVYFISSWWNWYYGPSFGQRPFVEFYAFLGLLIAYLLKSLRSEALKTVFLILVFICICLNLIQNYQYKTQIMSSWDMNFEKYKYIFLKTSPSYIGCLGGNNDIMLYKPDKTLVYEASDNFEDAENTYATHCTFDTVRNSKVCDYSNLEFNLLFEIPVNENFISKRDLFAKVKLDRIELDAKSCTQALFVIEISNNKNERYFYYSFPINEVPSYETNIWKSYNYSIQLRKIKNSDDIIKIYVWNKNKKSFYLDNINISIYSIN